MNGTPGSEITIAHVSDLHLGAHDPDAARSLVADVATARPTVTVVTGDLTMRARGWQFRAASHLIGQLPEPRLVVLGNHDVPLLNPVARFSTPDLGLHRYLGGCPNPVLDAAGIRVLGLASAPVWRWKAGRVTRDQCRLVREVLGRAPAGAVRVLALHHPPAATGLFGRGRLAGAMATAGVELVLAGHTHVPAARRLGLPGPADADDSAGTGAGRTVLEVIAGTATSSRVRGTGRSWTLIRVGRGVLLVERRVEVGGAWISGGITRFRR